MKTWKKYFYTVISASVISVIVIFWRGFSNTAPTKDRWVILADAFTIPAIALIVLSLMLQIGRTGFFDILGYGFSRACNVFIPFYKSDCEKYYDYKARVAAKRKDSPLFMLYTGLVFLAVSFVFIYLYYNTSP